VSTEPQISIVTPCLNAAGVIRDVINSVKQSSTGAIEHIVVDGGSTDGTQEILQEYDHLILIFTPDDGPYDALNTGFAHALGDVMGWINADDLYVPRALDVVADIFSRFDAVEWLTTTYPLFAGAAGQIVGAARTHSYSRYRSLHPDATRFGGSLPTAMQQESTFWRRQLWKKSGAYIDANYKFAADFELWLRFWQHAEVYAANAPFGCFRWGPSQRSQVFHEEYARELDDILQRYGGEYAGSLRTLGRRAALSLRGLPQDILKFLPCAHSQQTANFDRDAKCWQISKRFFIPD
jgi:glycosyltransferase involved in cell wall biosynthesis